MGGAVSKATGGTFDQGANTAAFGYLFNCSMSRDCRQHSRAQVDNNVEAVAHYWNGNGMDVMLGPESQKEAQSHPRIKEAIENLKAGRTDQNRHFDVDFAWSRTTHHIGATKVLYSTLCDSGLCTTTFSVFGLDRFEDPFSIGQYGRSKAVEVGGTPYRYKPFNFSHTYKDPNQK
jgi:hypothetical protein